MIMIIEISKLGFNDVMKFPRYLDNNSKYFIVSIINTIQFFPIAIIKAINPLAGVLLPCYNQQCLFCIFSYQ